MATIPEKMKASSEGLDEVQEGRAVSQEKRCNASEELGEVEKDLSEIPDGQVKVPKALDSENLLGLPKGLVELQNRHNAEKSKMKAEDEKYEVEFLNTIIYITSFLSLSRATDLDGKMY